ncbi:hydantoinase/oxoprolinase family protein [Aquamicrobium lusatiense]|uniref:hydantoinase/oxoprolinase family protein n=1 Tax=Aquamicrobium lusatiense TaxID=89772 RepID=UPI00245609B4|nr:hydantoinase/oxoprolinase family protein [Aquamicrobium lusatiense]MDH4989315.1 hydantoinase/oxoprolinase family protein [Aquamicrobium lusatiense]
MTLKDLYLGVDVGGTFTDLVFFDGDGVLHSYKVPSTPDRPGMSTLQGIREIAGLHGLTASDLARLHHTHGSTIAINTLIERRGAATALITTDGYRDLYELGRLALPEPMRYDSRRATPLTPRRLVREVGGRLDAEGCEMEPLDENSVVAALHELRDAGAQSLVVCLMHSYRNPAHERRVAELAALHVPDLPCDLSCETWPQAREYERAILTTINAYVRPNVVGYLDHLVSGTRELGLAAEPRVIRSNGGMQRASTIRRNPVTSLLSGPAAGVSAAAAVARAAGMEGADLVTVDVGGTSVDVGIVRAGQPLLSAEEHISDFPVLTPCIAVSSVGAGGGSMIWLDELGALKVGPRSVGADPGPACYGRGTTPALTDAFLLAGWLADGQLLAGRIPLHLEAARKAMAPVAEGLGLSVESAADAAIALAIAVMAAETSGVLAQRGVDAPEFSLVAYGGAGPLIGALLAEAVYIDRMILPQAPGVLSALGAVSADLEIDLIRPVYSRLSAIQDRDLQVIMQDMETEADACFREESQELPIIGREIIYAADMRYEGQGFDVSVALDSRWLAQGDLAAVAGAFHEAHRRTYGYAKELNPIWLKEVRAHIVGTTPKPVGAEVAPGTGAKSFGTRRVRISGVTYDARLYRRGDLGAGDTFEGPAIIEQQDTTVLVPPGWVTRQTQSGVLVLERPGVATTTMGGIA